MGPKLLILLGFWFLSDSAPAKVQQNPEVIELKAALEDRENMIADLREELAIVEDDTYEKAMGLLEDKIWEYEEIIEELEGRLEKAQTAIYTRQRQIEALRLELAKVERAPNYDHRFAEYEERHGHLLSALEENALAMQQMEERQKRQKKEHEAELAREARQQEALKDQLHEWKQKTVEKTEQLAALQGTYSELQGAVEGMRAFESKYLEERQKRKEQEDFIAQVRDQLQDHKQNLQKLERHRRQLAKEIHDPIPKRMRTHTVQRGDTLSLLSQKYYGSSLRWRDIYEYNKLLIPDQDSLIPGTRLEIP